ncbi:DUF2865 domain-containing protein [Ahrensia kielensis]|uniref:DUF2865 domain-containing protein n=1 Tax=Ahrensia kielensis TaxID=76980 RepID=A0ABU9T568_9HYPH|nr:DUF2865 domain-containing protein [Ahrensia kielensis]
MLGSKASFSRFPKRAATLFAALASFVSVSMSDAQASPQQCASLQHQLSSLSGGSSNYAKYDAAAERQSTEIWYVKRDMRRANCNSSNSGQCRAMTATLRKMNANYKALIRKRESFSGGSGRRAQSIKRKLAALNCNSSGQTTRKKSVIVKTPTAPRKATPSIATGGGYRTMCVRTCDGYYFPVSHASSNRDFKRDEAICNALCPATESRLFVYKNSTEAQSEEMVSLEGKPYTELPTAFKYRTQTRSPTCSCGVADPAAVGLSTGEAAAKAETKQDDPLLKRLPAPTSRPNLFADAESRLNAQADLTAQTMKQFVAPKTKDEIIASANQRNVRVVGPEFLPDPEAAINLQAPAPTRVQ